MDNAATEITLSGVEHFRRRGIIQQHGAVLVRLGVILDSAVILVVLYFLAKHLGTGWDERHLLVAMFAIFCFEALASFRNLYRSWRLVRLREELLEILLPWAATAAVVSVTLFFLLNGEWSPDRRILAYWYLLSFLGIIGLRIVMRVTLRYYRAFGHDHRTVAFVGVTDVATRLTHIFRTHPWMGIDVVGCFDDPDAAKPDSAAVETPQPLAGNVKDLLDKAAKDEVDAVYITLPMAMEDRIRAIVDLFNDTTLSVYYCPDLSKFDLLDARWDDILGQPVISIVESPFGGYERYLKRLEDLTLVALILPVIVLPLLMIALAVKLTSPGPILYGQNRHGLNQRIFKIWKFRTMYVVESDDEFVQAKRGDARITPLGAFLRKTSLDELPQFFNVLRGDMSVVGPRPHPTMLNETHRKLIRRYALRHKVKPGITGWAQVNNYRGETETLDKMERRIEYDLEYIRTWSIWLDLKVLLWTLFRAFAPADR
jgi:putative colanic acid biosynthesis UDP-glucose lipid carrier transferase